MLEVLAYSVALAAIFMLAGAPLAIAVRGHGEGLAALLHDALVQGLVAITIGTFVLGWYGRDWAIAYIAGYCLATGYVLFRRFSLPARLRIAAWTCAVALVCIAAGILRLRADQLIVAAEDQGGYVNWANQLIRTGHFRMTYPPGLPSYMAISGKLFGIDNTTAGIPLLGMLLIFSLLRLFGQLRVPPVARIAVVAIAAVQLHALWYSSFPAAESLHAPLLLSLLSLMVTALRSRGRALAACCLGIALITTLLGLNRSSTILLLVPLVIIVIGCWTRGWSRYARALSFASAAMLVGLYAGYLFGIVEIYPYYVKTQIRELLPTTVYTRSITLGVFDRSVALFALMSVGLVLTLLPGLRRSRMPSGAHRRARRQRASAAPAARWPYLFGIAMSVAGFGLIAYASTGEAAAAIGRIGWWLPVAAGLVMLVPRIARGRRGPIVVFASVIAVLFVLVEVVRFGAGLDHPVYLYYDRYMFSEYVPCLLLILGVGCGAALEYVHSRLGRPFAVAVLTGLTVSAMFSYLTVDQLATRHTMFAGAYDFESRLAATVQSDPAPVLWSATAAGGVPGMFPNTWWSLGLPLNMTWGIDVLGLDGSRAFGPDAVVSAGDISAELTKGRSRIYVVDVIQPTGATLDQRAASTDYSLRRVATVSGHIDLLGQPAATQWTSAPITAQVWLATRQTVPTS